MNEFGAFASWYDRFSDRTVYPAYAEFFADAVGRFSDIAVSDVLDLGCGTGLLGAELIAKGYGVVGIDSSVEMLDKAHRLNPSMLLINRSIDDFELYGTVQAALCTLDTLNYLQSSKQLLSCFGLVANYLETGGLFVFDMNTKYRFSDVYGNNDFVYEDRDDVFVWRNADGAKTHDMVLTLFRKNRDGSYTRLEEVQRQRYFSPLSVKRMLADVGIDIIGVYGGKDFSALGDTTEKLYFVTKRNGKNANRVFAEE